ncbi:MAG: ABC transporter permease [Jatrophihabitantaceae bacterium]
MRRVLEQLRHDPRTIGLLVVVPALLMVLLRYVFDSEHEFSLIAPALLGIFPFLTMFLVTSIATLRERTSGTLERLMTTPLAKLALLGGYGAAFSVIAIVQVAVTTAVSLALGMTVHGSLAWLVVVTIVDALLGVALGLLASAFAATEFQAIQLMPVVVLPQILLCGLFQPRAQMATVLRWLADVLPVSYAVEALQHVAGGAALDRGFARDLVVLAAFVAGALVAGAATLRRHTA